jgi:hypothetical protein
LLVCQHQDLAITERIFLKNLREIFYCLFHASTQASIHKEDNSICFRVDLSPKWLELAALTYIPACHHCATDVYGLCPYTYDCGRVNALAREPPQQGALSSASAS